MHQNWWVESCCFRVVTMMLLLLLPLWGVHRQGAPALGVAQWRTPIVASCIRFAALPVLGARPPKVRWAQLRFRVLGGRGVWSTRGGCWQALGVHSHSGRPPIAKRGVELSKAPRIALGASAKQGVAFREVFPARLCSCSLLRLCVGAAPRAQNVHSCSPLGAFEQVARVPYPGASWANPTGQFCWARARRDFTHRRALGSMSSG